MDFIIDKIPTVSIMNEIEEQEYIVHNIPETLTVSTLIRQFVRPKNFGPLVSKSDLDMEKMQKFIDRNLIENGLVVYMKVARTEAKKFDFLYFFLDIN